MDEYLKDAFQTRDPLVGSWVLIGHPTVAEITAGLGFDFVVLDTEHPSYSLETLDTMIAGVVAADRDTSPIVRVPLDEPNRITRVLNTGATGILFPVIETAAQAREAAKATKYPPDGTRTIAPGRGSNYLQDFETYVKTANDATVTIVMIETERGLNNAAEIAAAEGVDAVLIGHEDLSASLGIFAQWDHDRLQTAIDRIITTAHEGDTAVGRVTPDSEAIEATIDRGFDFLITGVDIWQLTQAGQRAKAAFDSAVED